MLLPKKVFHLKGYTRVVASYMCMQQHNVHVAGIQLLTLYHKASSKEQTKSMKVDDGPDPS